MRLSIIVAMSENRVIGRGGRLPWHLPPDLKRFKALTTGHTIIMGRRTFESIGKPLPQRRSIVITRNPAWRAQGVEVANNLNQALAMAKNEDEVFVIGGAEIFHQALPQADRMYFTLIHADIEGDTYFPQIDLSQWRLEKEQHHEANAKNPHAFSFRVYERTTKRKY
jgi:dihydrofolate reductase